MTAINQNGWYYKFSEVITYANSNPILPASINCLTNKTKSRLQINLMLSWFPASKFVLQTFKVFSFLILGMFPFQ